MISNALASRPLWTIATCCLLTACSGCKHVSTWSNVPPAVSVPSADPWGYPPSTDDGYLHRPPSAPAQTPAEPLLSPVPPLPPPGHSEPVDLPPPPAPAEGARSNSSGTANSLLSRSKSMFRLPAMKFLQRKDSETETVQSSAQLPATTIDDKPAVNTGRAVPLPLSKLDRRPVGNSLESQPRALPTSETTEHHELLAPVVPTQQTSQSELAAPRTASDAAEIEHTWPIITPGAQYVTGNELQPVPESAFRREIKVEPWPYSSYRSANLKLRKPLLPALDTELQPASTQSVPVPPVTPDPPAATSAAAVPPLLPPSP